MQNEYMFYLKEQGNKELKEKSVGEKVPNNLHKPWIDEVKLKCECGHEMAIEGDVLDEAVVCGFCALAGPRRDVPFDTEAGFAAVFFTRFNRAAHLCGCLVGCTG